jgi:hypothetical protein
LIEPDVKNLRPYQPKTDQIATFKHKTGRMADAWITEGSMVISSWLARTA